MTNLLTLLLFCWDPNPVGDMVTNYAVCKNYNVVTNVGNTNFASVPLPADVPAAYTVFAQNAAGSSGHSDPVIIDSDLLVQVNCSTNMCDWTNMWNVATKPTNSSVFFQLKIVRRTISTP